MAEAQSIVVPQPASITERRLLSYSCPPVLESYDTPDILVSAGSPVCAKIEQNFPAAPRLVKREKVQARRFTGKENVEDYLLQFELTARHNGWDADKKSAALLCALDGQARGTQRAK